MSANGRLTDGELETVEDNDRLSRTTAAAFRNARAAWYAEGGSGACIVEPAGAYRDYETQRRMKYGIPSYAYWNLNPNSKAGLASPGSSTHGTGTRFDATSGFNNFLLRRGREFGFTREFGANDPNHWKHDGRTATTGGGASIIPGIPDIDYSLLRRRKEDTMYVRHEDAVTNPQIYATSTDANNRLRLRYCQANEAAAADAGGLVIAVNDTTLTGLGIEAGWLGGKPQPVVPIVSGSTATSSGISDADAEKIAAAVIVEQKKPGN